MIFANAHIVDENFNVRKCDIQVIEGKIAKIGENLSGDEILNMSGKYILPGFIDTHFHGANGVRVNNKAEDILKITSFEVTQGVTSVAITTSSTEFSELILNMKAIAKATETPIGAKIIGIHAEGPFLNIKKKGAMNPENILVPDKEKLDAMIESSNGLLKLITIAPDVDGAIDFIKYAHESDITVSLGHTDATYDIAEKAFLAGATQTTHTFNAMRAYSHREPGILGAALTNPEIVCEMICDYVHLHPATVKLIYLAKGADNINMISDSEYATGLNIKEFMADGQKVYLKDGVLRLEDGTISGSAMTLLDGVKHLLHDGYPIGDVAKMASLNPAKSMKADDYLGSIKVGKCADFAVLDEEFELYATFIDGKRVF